MNTTKIIAECGISHLGSVDKAKELIFESSECGADGVKFQYYNPYDLFDKSKADKRDKLMLSAIEYEKLYEWKQIRDINIDFGVSVFDDKSQPLFDFLKIASIKLLKIAVMFYKFWGSRHSWSICISLIIK